MAMKKVKRPVTEEKKNIAATHAVMDKVNLIGDKFQYGHTKIFFRAGILGLMEEIRDDCINSLVAMLQVGFCCPTKPSSRPCAFSTRDVAGHHPRVLCAQDLLPLVGAQDGTPGRPEDNPRIHDR